MTFIDELLLESEQKEKEQLLQMNRLRADQILATLMVLEKQADGVNTLVEDEIQILEEYRQVELQKVQKKTSWLAYNLEQFIRSSNEKTINLPHGSIKLRMGRDKVEITDLEKFLTVADKKGLLRELPSVPDLQKIKDHIQNRKGIPPGVTLTPAQTRFSYTTKGKNNGNGEGLSAESDTSGESIGNTETST